MTIEDFEWHVRDFAKARPGAKPALRETLRGVHDEAVIERELVRGKLNRQWRVPEATLSEEQIDKCILTLKLYERWSAGLYAVRKSLDLEKWVDV